MKKIHYFIGLILIGAITITSCQKEKAEIKDGQTNTEVSIITRQLKAFKQDLQSKSGETMAADSAEWYLEGLLNLEQAYNDLNFGDVDFYHNTLTVTVTDGQISLNELNNLYTTINAWAADIQQQSGNEDYTFVIVDLIIEETGLKSGEKNLVVTLSGGLPSIGLNYYPFGPTDYWVWGLGLGKCGGFSGFIGKDASTELQRKFRNPIAVPGPGYYTSVWALGAYGYEFDDLNNPYGNYMIFGIEGTGNPPTEEYCISPDELNYYLSKFDYIKGVKQQQALGRVYKTVEVHWDMISGGGAWYKIHYYTLYYGFKIENPT